MSYTKRIGDKEYEFASEKAYETYLKLATSAAQQNGITPQEAFETNYQKYVDVGSPLVAQNKEVQTSIPNVYETLYGNANASQQSAYALAEKARQEAEAQAEIERKRGVVDANTLYQQQKATYGANAEQLGRMGLNVSGYSDYLNSQAYASGMAYRQAANAQAAESKRQAAYQEALSKLEADKTYHGMLNEIESAKIADAQAQEQQKQANYMRLWELAASGVDVSEIAKEFGLSEEQAASLSKETKSATTTQAQTQQEAIYSAFLEYIEGNGGIKDETALSNYASAIGLTDETLIDKAKTYNETLVKETSKVDADFIKTSPEEAFATEDKIAQITKDVEDSVYDESDIPAIKEAYSDYVTSGLYNADGTLNMTLNEAKEYLNNLENDKLLTDKAKAQFKAAYSATFEANRKTINMSGDFDPSSLNFAGSNNKSSKQYAYISEIHKAVENEMENNNNGKYSSSYSGLKVGDVVDMNYGIDAGNVAHQMVGGIWGLVHGTGSTAYYVYKGNGVFEKVSTLGGRNLYIPDNYRKNAIGQIKEK